MNLLALVLLIEGMYQIDQRSHYTRKASIDANRRLLIAGVCWVGAVGFVL